MVNEGEHAGHRRGLGGRENAGEDAVQNDHHGAQTPERIQGDLRRLTQRHRLVPRIAASVGHVQAQRDQAKTGC